MTDDDIKSTKSYKHVLGISQKHCSQIDKLAINKMILQHVKIQRLVANEISWLMSEKELYSVFDN